MPSNYLTIGGPLVLVLGTFSQLFLTPLITTSAGVGRVIQPITDFPAYKCRKIIHTLVEGCEDLFLDEKDRKLYAACADPEGRKAYQPTVDRLNVSGRTGYDRFMVLSIDTPGPKRDFTPVRLSTSGYKGVRGTELDLHGFDVEAIDEDTLRFFAINHRPPINASTGAPLDAPKVGLNSTVEVFELTRGTSELRWKKTYAEPDVIRTPNRVAATGEGGFVVTNDHLTKTHWSRAVEPLTGGGSLAVCSSQSCHLGTGNHLKHPNGLARSHHDGLYYVPSSIDGHILVFRLDPPGVSPRKLKRVADINVGMPMDNVVVDANGMIWAAAFPKLFELVAAFDHPRTAKVPAAVFRIERRKAVQKEEGVEGVEHFEYAVEKVLEDRDGELLPAATTVVHDVKTGRLFLGGVFSPFITVCERTDP